jgi:hypothetical protein
MDEVFPVLAGVAVGLVAERVPSTMLRAALIAVLGAALGVVASWLAGELAISWFYTLIDTAQVVVAAVATVALVALWRRRVARRVAS